MDIEINKQNYIKDKEDLIELLLFFWQKKLFVLLLSSVGLFSSLVYTSTLEDIYTAEAIVTSNTQVNSMNDIASRLSGFGAFSAFGGSSINSQSGLARAIMKSRDFYSTYFYQEILAEIIAIKSWDKESEKLIYDDNLYNPETKEWKVKKPTVQESHDYFLQLYTLESTDDGTMSLKVNHFSPVVAKSFLDMILENINKRVGQADIEQTKRAIDFLTDRRSKTTLVGMREVIAKMIEEQTKSLMLANISNEYVFTIVDPAVIPESPSGPNRRLLYFFGITIGFFLSIGTLLIRRFFFNKE